MAVILLRFRFFFFRYFCVYVFLRLTTHKHILFKSLLLYVNVRMFFFWLLYNKKIKDKFYYSRKLCSFRKHCLLSNFLSFRFLYMLCLHTMREQRRQIFVNSIYRLSKILNTSSSSFSIMIIIHVDVNVLAFVSNFNFFLFRLC